MVTRCTQHTLNHGDNARSPEKVHLPRIFLEDLCEGKSLNSPLAIVMRRRLDGNMCWMAALAGFYTEKAGMSGVGGTQAQKDVEERA